MADEHRHDEVNSDSRELEQALAALTPRASSIDRDRLLFLAGQAFVSAATSQSRFSRWAWPTATCFSTTAAVVMLAMLVARPGDDVNSRVVQPSEVASRDAHGSIQPNQAPSARDVGGTIPPTSRSNSLAAASLSDHPNYLQLRAYVLAYGVNALPERDVSNPSPDNSVPSTKSPLTPRELLKDLLNSEIHRQDNRL